MVTTGNPTAVATEEPEPTSVEDVLAQVEAVLAAHPALDLESRAAIRNTMRVDLPQAIARRKTQDFWRAFIRRHGLRAAERTTNISRFHLLMVCAGLEDNLAIYGTLHLCVGRADEVDAEAAERVTRNGDSRRP
jgi:hypothetical protein